MTSPPPPINPIVAIQPLSVSNIAQNTAQSPVLAGAKHGDIIEGFVVNRDAKQNPILRTPLGDILVKSDIFLKTGSQVQIRVDAQLASRARIILIDGQSPENYVKQTQTAPQKSDVILPSSLMAQAKSAPALPAQLLTLPAIILRQQEAGVAKPALAQPLTGKSTSNVAAPSGQVPTGQPSAPMPTTGATVQVTILTTSLLGAGQPTVQPVAASLSQPSTATAEEPAAPATPSASSTSNKPSEPLPQNNTNTIVGKPSAPLANAATPNSATTNIPAAPANTAAPLAAGQTNIAATNNAPAATPTATATANTLNAEDMAMLLRASAPQNQTAKSASPALHSQYSALPAQEVKSGEQGVRFLPPQQGLPAQYRPNISPVITQALQAHIPPQTSAPQFSAQAPAGANATGAVATTPAPSSTSVQAGAPAESLVMRVIGHEADGASILRNNELTLKLFTARPLPNGSLLHVQIAPQTLAHTEASLLPSRLVDIGNLYTHWPAMEEALELAGNAVPTSAGAAPLAASIAPEIGPKLAGDMLFFINALRAGDIKTFWPKALAEAIETKRPDILGRMQADMTALAPLTTPATNQSWASYMMPMLFQQQLEHMRLYVRTDDGSDASKDAVHNQRFIMEISLSHLSDMQLDGFVQGKGKPHQFDLVIRTERALPDAVENELQSLFTAGLQSIRLNGRIQFQVGREHFVTPETLNTPANHTEGGDDYTILA